MSCNGQQCLEQKLAEILFYLRTNCVRMNCGHGRKVSCRALAKEAKISVGTVIQMAVGVILHASLVRFDFSGPGIFCAF